MKTISNPKTAVMDFINQNFVISEIKITDFPLFRHGKKITDRNGDELVVFWDSWAEAVKYEFPKE